MSADNCAICPKCPENTMLQHYRDIVDNGYGKVGAQEYANALKMAENIVPEYTLREDWEIGEYQGRFIVNYSARCTECGYDFSFEHEALYD